MKGEGPVTVTLPLSERFGHTLVLGTTRAGKTGGIDMNGNDARQDADPGPGLPDLDRDTADTRETAASGVNNSTKTKIFAFAVVFLVAVLAGGAIAIKSLSSASQKGGEPSQAVAVAADIDADPGAVTLADVPVGSPLAVPLNQASNAATPASAPTNAFDERIARLEDSLTQVQADGEQLWEELSTVSRDLRAQMSDLQTALASLTEKLASLNNPADNASEALTAIETRLKRLDTRLDRLDRRSQDNWKQLHGEAGARRRGASLPFSVTAIDWWDEQPSVAVRTGAKARFLAPGDAVAGWRLVSADPATGQARFVRNGREAVAQVMP